MEIIVWAYQITPGSDEMLCFAVSEEACRFAALEQREEIKRLDPDYEDLAAMNLYEYRLRPMTADELVQVLNEQKTVVEACVISHRLAGVIVD